MSEPAAGDVRVHVAGVTHRYGSVTALDDVELEILAGEFVTLLGPSGCGKTTLLRAIAGFVRPTAGRIVIGGRDVTREAAHRRPVNMVFQRATLFPHLDVERNVGFGLRIARVPRSEAGPRVAEALRLVRLDGYERRRAHELSGGQLQRVALARALVNRPQVLLLDEPLSALDLKIRLEMEVELRRVHRETGATFVYVTHDQREALALSDRIAVFDEGRVQQLGTPEDIYHAPSSPFTARFVGDANVVPVEVVSSDAAGAAVQVGAAQVTVRRGTVGTGPAWLVLRPEALRVAAADGAVDGSLQGTVADLAFRGTAYAYRVDVPGLSETLKVEAPGDGAPLAVGDAVYVTWGPDAASLLPRQGGEVE